MAMTPDPWGDAWEAFFLAHPLPLSEEQAFRQYLAARQVPDGTHVQDLQAHYEQFLREWEPGQTPRERT
jgi:hypothetical protein